MKIEKLESKIFYYKNIIKDPDFIISEIEETDTFCDNSTSILKWNDWYASDNKDIKYGWSKDGCFSKRKCISENDYRLYRIANEINGAIKFSITNYCYLNQIEDLWLPDFFSIRKYSTGADMGPHTDSEDPTTSNHPYVSGVLYLNDSYNGGEIDFVNQSINIKPEKGSLLIFPSYPPYTHHPKKITDGNKYIVPLFWFKKGQFK